VNAFLQSEKERLQEPDPQ